MNPNVPLDIFIPPSAFPHIHLLVTADPHGLNNGVFFIKVHPWSVELITAVVAFPYYRPETELQYRDQSALFEVLKEKHFKNNFLYLPQRWINAYQQALDPTEAIHPFQLQRGDLLVHFPGVPDRDERMRFYLDKAERHLPEWELDLIHTSYPTDIKEFWAKQHVTLEAQRAELRKAIEDAEITTKTTEADLMTFRGELGKQEAERIDAQLETMKQVLSGHSDDLDALVATRESLHKACFPSLIATISNPKPQLSMPLRNLTTEAQKGLEDANALIYSAEKQVLGVDEDDIRYFTDVRRVQARLEVLKELVAAKPVQSGKIRSAIEEVQRVSKPMRAWAVGWKWRILCALNMLVLTMVVRAQASEDFGDKLKRDDSRRERFYRADEMAEAEIIEPGSTEDEINEDDATEPDTVEDEITEDEATEDGANEGETTG
ncbi:hypothetical protein MMC08_008468 [Hypocenomyce scalaris]|nr:hypothetical protein [Hypocenomyce scalaris]